VTALAVTAPHAIPYALFIAGGPLLSIPLAVWSASRSVGSVLLRIGLGRLPEETMPPPSFAEILASTDATAFSRAPA
jgi:membrane glycosyltransferase